MTYSHKQKPLPIITPMGSKPFSFAWGDIKSVAGHVAMVAAPVIALAVAQLDSTVIKPVFAALLAALASTSLKLIQRYVSDTR
jgi:hypothetical protein